MNDLIPFDYGDHHVRVVEIDGEPWFVAADVCAVLGLSNVSMAVASLDEADLSTTEVRSSGQRRRMNIVNEAGLYELIFQSRREEARTFRRWVTHDLLPKFRRGEIQQAPNYYIPKTYAEALALAAKQTRELEASEAKVAELEPAAHTWEQLAADAHGDYAMRTAAQILNRDPAISTGQNRLAKYLRAIGWTDRHGTPYQKQVDSGRLVARVTSYDHPHTGEPKLSTQIRITPKGLHELHKRLGGERPLLLAA